MPRPIAKKISLAVNDYVKNTTPLTPRIARLASFARADLYFGPIQGCDDCGADYHRDCKCETKWPGFTAAVEEIEDWAQDNLPRKLFYDSSWDGVFDSEPESEI